jgi:thioredoxin
MHPCRSFLFHIAEIIETLCLEVKSGVPMSVQMIDAAKFKELIFNYDQSQEFAFTKSKPVILNFSAVWCGPCQMFRPALESIAEKYRDQLEVYKVDIDTDPELPALFGIMSVPTTIFFAPNEDPAMAQGNIGEHGLQKAVNEIFKLT